MEECTIQQALSRSKITRQNATAAAARQSSPRERAAGSQGGGGDQRLSDMSLSTDSSEPGSLELSYSSLSAFGLPPLHDPSPPTTADYAAHLPLSLSPPLHRRPRPDHPHPRGPDSSMEEEDEDDDEDDDDDDEEEEADFGVSLESDPDGEQDQDLTLEAPGRHRRGGANRRASAGALGLQRALRGQLRKMSGVFRFGALLTPEKRAVRRVLELSRDKASYFGCLVQDYLSYMCEGSQAWQGHASGLELLQTLRQFMTQMKNYLRQSSELEPPIESLIPEEQIGERTPPPPPDVLFVPALLRPPSLRTCCECVSVSPGLTQMCLCGRVPKEYKLCLSSEGHFRVYLLLQSQPGASARAA